MFRSISLNRLATWSFIVALLVVVYAPLVAVLVLSFNSSTLSTEWKDFSFKWYVAAFRDPNLKNAFGNSVFIAATTAMISVILGAGAALSQRQKTMTFRASEFLLRVPLFVPDMAMAVSLGIYLHEGGLGDTIFSVVLAHSGWGIAIVYLVVSSTLSSLPNSLEAAAVDCGASRWQTLIRIRLPLAVPSVGGSALLVFALSLSDFTYALFCSGSGSTTLPVFLYSSLRYRFTPAVFAAFVVMIVATASLIAAAIVVLRGSITKITSSETDPG